MKRKKTRMESPRLLESLEPRLFMSGVPVIALAVTKATATELNGTTTGIGKFQLTRSGSTALPLTVYYTLDAASTAVNGVDFNVAVPLSGSATFAAGSSKALISIAPADTQLADGPKTVILDLAGDTSGSYALGSHIQGKVTIVDHAPTVSVSATRQASEINGQGKGAGTFTFKRSGPTTSPLTVQFTLGGTAVEGTDYTTVSPHSVTIPAGASKATVTIAAIDDLDTEGKESVVLALAADGAPASYHFKTTAATVNIADDTRPIFFGAAAHLAGHRNSPSTFTYDQLATLTGVRAKSGTVSFKITAIKSGTLKINGTAAQAGKTIVHAGDTLTWTPRSGATGATAAFALSASDGLHATAAMTLTVDVAASVAHPQLEVLSAALDQPQINAIAYVGSNSVPQVGQTTTLDPDTLDSVTINTFNVSGYLDTGASGILISNPTNTIWNLPLLSDNGTPVIYSDVGVAGSDDFQVSDSVRLALASFYQRTDLDQFSDAGQTVPITTPYTLMDTSVRTQVGPFVPTVDNPVTDEFSSLFDELSALDVIGMPAMMGKVVVIDPTRVNNFGTVLDQLLADPTSLDLTALDADMGVHSFLYAPGTPFHATTTATDPGIPSTDVHVKLSYASFDRFTQVTPAGNPGPTLAHNPFIGEDPIAVMEGTATGGTPGIKITRDISVPDGNGGTTTQTLSSEGNWLLDTGAAASIISKAQAAKLNVTYAPGTFGTDAPVLIDQDGNPLPNQFTLGIGGIGGQQTLAGFYLDTMLVRTMEGDAGNDADPNHLMYVHEPVLVGDITVKDPSTGDTLTLDGIFGMNNLIGSADFSMDALGNLGDFSAAQGWFNWITFDEPAGVLGLSFDPTALAAATSSAVAAPSASLLATSALAPTAGIDPFADLLSGVSDTGSGGLAASLQLVSLGTVSGDAGASTTPQSELSSYSLLKSLSAASGGTSLDSLLDASLAGLL